jgi:formiminoglutamase
MTVTWNSSDPSVFFSKNDPQDPRLGDCTRAATEIPTPANADLLIWGYPDDEGIRLNGGRIGAAEAPRAIRTIFYKMTPHVGLKQRPRLFDLGDLNPSASLADRHHAGAQMAKFATDSGSAWVSLGGGHDYGYADGAGFLRAQNQKRSRPLVINFDAHLDVRPTTQGLNSGTPFFRLLNEFGGQFDFVEVGLQPQCNSTHHWEWATSQGAHLISLEETQQNGLLKTLQKTLSPFKGQALWLSLDIDAITSSEAPGCSQSWTTGLKTAEILECLSWLKQTFDWRSLSIYEVSPPLDSDLRTVKLAAQFLHYFLYLQMRKSAE